MGRRADPDQAAKGYPGRRKSKADKAAEAAQRLALLLSPGDSNAKAPAMLEDPKYAPALAVWRRLAPELRRTHRLPPETEMMFMTFCIYSQEWTSATEDLHLNGFTQAVGTVAGGKMERRRPPTFDRQIAFQNMERLAGSFGLTPNDLYALFKGQAAVAQSNPGLFDRGEGAAVPAGRPDAAETEADDRPPSLVASMAALRSAPPSEPIN